MNSHPVIRRSMIAAGLVLAVAAVPFGQAMAWQSSEAMRCDA
jgi:hypothetical protein